MSASEQRLYYLLQMTSHRLKKRADVACVEAAELTTAQAAVLAIVNDQGPVSQSRIAAQLSHGESAMTKMAARLQNAGYITKVRSKDDARAWALQSTKVGEEALRKIKKPFKDINDIFDKTFDEGEVNRLADDLKRLLAALSQ